MSILFTFSIEEAPLVEPLTNDTIRITFDSEVVVDSLFSDTGSYVVAVVEGEGPVSVREVLTPEDSRTTRSVILVVDKPTHGTHYRVTVAGLTGRDGALVGGSSDFFGRRTKAEDMVRSMPMHYSRRPDSLIRNILTAIGIEDETIGGSRDDTFL